MNNKMRLIAGIALFGSLWGFSECIIGPMLADAGLPYGIIMTGLFAMIFLTVSRIIYNQRRMQIGMGLTAGALKLLNPFGGYQVCSAIAIMAEGLVFELIWNYMTTSDFHQLKSLRTKVSLGIFTAYCVYVVGFVTTQVLTPVLYTGFYLENLISFLPNILSKGVPAALLGGITVSLALSTQNITLTIKDKIYYPTTLGLATLCWIVVLSNWYIIGA
jgi:hypothetical protein